jgi:hypothetical protein
MDPIGCLASQKTRQKYLKGALLVSCRTRGGEDAPSGLNGQDISWNGGVFIPYQRQRLIPVALWPLQKPIEGPFMGVNLASKLPMPRFVLDLSKGHHRGFEVLWKSDHQA